MTDTSEKDKLTNKLLRQIRLTLSRLTPYERKSLIGYLNDPRTDFNSYIIADPVSKHIIIANKESLSVTELKTDIDKINDILKSILQTLRNIDNRDDNVFGRFLFADERKDLPLRQLDPNTREESAFFHSLHNHYAGKQPLSNEYRKLLRKLIRQGAYTKMLMPRPGDVYRGLTLSIKKFNSAFDIKAQEKLGGSIHLKKMIRVSRYGSWSYDPDVAIEFATNSKTFSSFDSYVLVLLRANTDENKGKFAINYENFLKKLKPGVFPYLHEKEVIQIGDVKIDAMTWKTHIPDTHFFEKMKKHL